MNSQEKVSTVQDQIDTTPSKAPLSSVLIDPGDLLVGSWEVYKKTWKKLLLLVLLNYVALIPLGIIAVGFVLFGMLNVKNLYSPLMVISATVAILLAIVYVTIISSLLSIALILQIKKRAENVSIQMLLKEAWEKLWGYWYISFIVGFLVIGGTFFFIVPGVIFSVWFSFALYIFLFEGIKGIHALVVSREYVRGRWLGVLGRGLLVGVLVTLLSYIPSVLLTQLRLKEVGGLIQTVISIAASPFPTIAAVLLYESAKQGRDNKVLATGRQKLTYIAIAIAGVIVMIALFTAFIYSAVTLFTMPNSPKSPIPQQYARPFTPQSSSSRGVSI